MSSSPTTLITPSTRGVETGGALNVRSLVDAVAPGAVHRVRNGLEIGLQKVADFYDSGATAGIFVSPTGSGKSRLISCLLKITGWRALVVAGDKMAVTQMEGEFLRSAPEMDLGVHYSLEKRTGSDGLITTYSSWVRLVNSGKVKPGDFDIVILDEGHFSLGMRRSIVAGEFVRSGMRVLATTATDKYSETKSLEKLIGPVIHRILIRDGIDAGLIAPYQNIICEVDVDYSKVPIVGGDYRRDGLEHVSLRSKLHEIGLEIVDTHFRDKCGIISCSGVKDAQRAAEVFSGGKYPTAALWGEMPQSELTRALDAFKAGDIRWLSFDKLLAHSVNLPTASVCLNLRQTFSRVLKEQINGRCERLDPDNPDKIFYPVCVLGRDSRRGGAISWTDVVDGVPVHGVSSERLIGAGLKIQSATVAPSLAPEVVRPRLTLDPRQVVVTLEGRRNDGNQIIPSDWRSADEIGAELGVSPRVVRQEIDALREDVSEEIQVGKRGELRAEFISPRAAELVSRVIDPHGYERPQYLTLIDEPALDTAIADIEKRYPRPDGTESSLRVDQVSSFRRESRLLLGAIQKTPFAIKVEIAARDRTENISGKLDLVHQLRKEQDIAGVLLNFIVSTPEHLREREAVSLKAHCEKVLRDRPLLTELSGLPPIELLATIGLLIEERKFEQHDLVPLFPGRFPIDRDLFIRRVQNLNSELVAILTKNQFVIARVSADESARTGEPFDAVFTRAQDLFANKFHEFSRSDLTIGAFVRRLLAEGSYSGADDEDRSRPSLQADPLAGSYREFPDEATDIRATIPVLPKQHAAMIEAVIAPVTEDGQALFAKALKLGSDDFSYRVNSAIRALTDAIDSEAVCAIDSALEAVRYRNGMLSEIAKRFKVSIGRTDELSNALAEGSDAARIKALAAASLHCVTVKGSKGEYRKRAAQSALATLGLLKPGLRVFQVESSFYVSEETSLFEAVVEGLDELKTVERHATHSHWAAINFCSAELTSAVARHDSRTMHALAYATTSSIAEVSPRLLIAMAKSGSLGFERCVATVDGISSTLALQALRVGEFRWEASRMNPFNFNTDISIDSIRQTIQRCVGHDDAQQKLNAEILNTLKINSKEFHTSIEEGRTRRTHLNLILQKCKELLGLQEPEWVVLSSALTYAKNFYAKSKVASERTMIRECIYSYWDWERDLAQGSAEWNSMNRRLERVRDYFDSGGGFKVIFGRQLSLKEIEKEAQKMAEDLSHCDGLLRSPVGGLSRKTWTACHFTGMLLALNRAAPLRESLLSGESLTQDGCAIKPNGVADLS